MRAGLQIPRDMALVGYDDIELALYDAAIDHHSPAKRMSWGELAIDVLIHRMADPQQKQQRVQLTRSWWFAVLLSVYAAR